MRILLTVLLALFMPGCVQNQGVVVPQVPEWVESGQMDADAVVAETLALCDVWPQLSDRKFTLVSSKWLDRALPWSVSFAKAIGLAYTPESFDCDKFAKALSLAAEISASRAGIKAQPLIARIYVQQVSAWGGVPAGGAHALNAVPTEKGVLVVEPQSGAKIPLKDYPNVKHIFAVKIGG